MKAKTIHLTLWERIKLPEILPGQAKHETGRLCVQIRRKLALKKEDDKKYKIVYANGPDGQYIKSHNIRKTEAVFFTATEMFIVVENFRRINDGGKLPTEERWLLLYDKFVGKEKRQGSGGTEEKPSSQNKGK